MSEPERLTTEQFTELLEEIGSKLSTLHPVDSSALLGSCVSMLFSMGADDIPTAKKGVDCFADDAKEMIGERWAFIEAFKRSQADAATGGMTRQ